MTIVYDGPAAPSSSYCVLCVSLAHRMHHVPQWKRTMNVPSRYRFGLLLPLLLAAAAPSAQEATCREISFPRHLQVSGSDLTLNGLGVRKATFLKVNVYVAALYVAQPSRDAKTIIESDKPQQLTLQFVRNVGVDDLRKAFVEGFERDLSAPSLKERAARLNRWKS